MGVTDVRQLGTVKWFHAQRGYGFIRPDTGGEDVFVHHTKIRMAGYRTLEEGARIEFDIEETAKGLAAVDVMLLEPVASPSPVPIGARP